MILSIVQFLIFKEEGTVKIYTKKVNQEWKKYVLNDERFYNLPLIQYYDFNSIYLEVFHIF